MDTKTVAKHMELPEKDYDVRDFEAMTPFSERWLRDMEKRGLIKFNSPKVRGQVKRLFQRADVANALYLAATRWVGIRPEVLEGYIAEVRKFRKIAAPYYKRQFDHPVDEVVYLFDLRDIFPSGDLENFSWPNDQRIRDSLTKIYALAWEARNCIRRAENLYQMVQMVEKDVLEFIVALKGRDEMLPYFAEKLNPALTNPEKPNAGSVKKGK